MRTYIQTGEPDEADTLQKKTDPPPVPPDALSDSRGKSLEKAQAAGCVG
jgi:hypothetical protein